MSYDGRDVYGVTRDGDTARVLHYPDPDARTPCCKTSVTVTAEDRAADPDGLGWCAALHRAYLETERRHGR
jgi:hypothetical protein